MIFLIPFLAVHQLVIQLLNPFLELNSKNWAYTWHDPLMITSVVQYSGGCIIQGFNVNAMGTSSPSSTSVSGSSTGVASDSSVNWYTGLKNHLSWLMSMLWSNVALMHSLAFYTQVNIYFHQRSQQLTLIFLYQWWFLCLWSSSSSSSESASEIGSSSHDFLRYIVQRFLKTVSMWLRISLSDFIAKRSFIIDGYMVGVFCLIMVRVWSCQAVFPAKLLSSQVGQTCHHSSPNLW